MLANWTKILPFFVVAWLARLYCEQWSGSEFDPNARFAGPYIGVFFHVKD